MVIARNKKKERNHSWLQPAVVWLGNNRCIVRKISQQPGNTQERKEKKGKKKKRRRREKTDTKWEGMRDFLCKHINCFAWSLQKSALRNWRKKFLSAKCSVVVWVFFLLGGCSLAGKKMHKAVLPVTSDSFSPCLSRAFTLALFLFIPCKYNGE